VSASGEVRLLDFGIAKLLNDSQHLTMTGFIIGTAAYMAPEQAAGKPIDDPTRIGAVASELVERARKNAGMDGKDLD